MNQRQQPYRSKRWLAAVGQIECCVLCGGYGVQVAHRNEGKGMGQKVSDCLTAALCQEHHYMIDSSRDLTRDQRRAMMYRAIVLTLEELVKRELIKPC